MPRVETADREPGHQQRQRPGMRAGMVFVQPETERCAQQRRNRHRPADQAPSCPGRTRRPASGLRLALSLRAAFAPTCSAKVVALLPRFGWLVIHVERSPIDAEIRSPIFAMTERTLCLLLVQRQKSFLHRVRNWPGPFHPIARRTETSTSRPVLTSTPSSTATKTSPSDSSRRSGFPA
jgi:hypothetical protein